MLIDRDEPGDRVEADVCVIGAGPAGISLAHELIGHRLRVAIIESGAYELDPDAEDLSRGITESEFYPPDALSSGRRRQFGGTSNLWVYRTEPGSGRRYARSLPPQEIDLEARGDDPALGWPFPLSALRPYLERAQHLWNGGPFEYEPTRWSTASRSPISSPGGELETLICQHGARDVFTLRYRDDLVAAENVAIHLGCTAVEVEADPGSASIRRVRVARRDGSIMSVVARAFVLAAGGVENVQLLLLSDAARPGGVANQHDTVGRYVTAHPELRLGTIELSDPSVVDALGLYDLHWVDGILVGGFLTLAEAFKRREGLLNVGVVLVPRGRGFGSAAHRAIASLRALRRREVPAGLPAQLASLVASPRDTAATVLGLRRPRYLEYSGGWSGPDVDRRQFESLEVFAATEQSARRDNRIDLAPMRDRLGRRRPRLHWRWPIEDRRNLERSTDVFADLLEGAGLGRFRRWAELDGPARPYFGGWHHPMGGTRMHVDPRHGVVDPECRVHGIDNLYVAGSSVFPSGHGYANPTLSIIALALRLADHLKGAIG